MTVSDIDEAGGLETLRHIRTAGGRSAFLRADAGNEADVRALPAFTETTFGGLDILANNAGPYFPGERLQHWDETLRANLMGAVYGTFHAIEPMRRRGGGAIVNYDSSSAVGHGRKDAPSPAYSSTAYSNAGMTP